MVNIAEDMDMTKMIEIVDDYIQKLINSEYSVEESRKVIIGGLKGYEHLLSLSKDRSNPRWKQLHMAGSWNQKNRIMAK